MLRRGMLIVAVALGAVPGIATAKLMLQLKAAVPKQLTTHTPITVSGDVNGELGAEFVAVFFSKHRCVREYASENRLSANATGTGVGYLTDQDEQGPFSMTVTLGKYGKGLERNNLPVGSVSPRALHTKLLRQSVSLFRFRR